MIRFGKFEIKINAMKKIIPFLIAAAFGFTGCGNNDKKTGSPPDSGEKKDSVSAEAPVPAGMSEVKYDCETDELFKGTKVASACWNDRRGKNLVVISQKEQYSWKEENPSMKKYAESEDDELAAELFACHFVWDESTEKWNTYWLLNDFNIGCCDVWIEYEPGTLEVKDIDGDGDGDPSFFYLIYSGTNGMDFYYNAKLITYSDSLKLKVSGTTGLGKAMIEEGGLKKETYDAAFKNVDKLFESYAKERWKNCHDQKVSRDEKNQMPI